MRRVVVGMVILLCAIAPSTAHGWTKVRNVQLTSGTWEQWIETTTHYGRWGAMRVVCDRLTPVLNFDYLPARNPGTNDGLVVSYFGVSDAGRPLGIPYMVPDVDLGDDYGRKSLSVGGLTIPSPAFVPTELPRQQFMYVGAATLYYRVAGTWDLKQVLPLMRKPHRVRYRGVKVRDGACAGAGLAAGYGEG